MQRFGVIRGEAFWYVVDTLKGFKIIEVAGSKNDALQEARELNQLEPPWETETCSSCVYFCGECTVMPEEESLACEFWKGAE